MKFRSPEWRYRIECSPRIGIFSLSTFGPAARMVAVFQVGAYEIGRTSAVQSPSAWISSARVFLMEYWLRTTVPL
jgi:hypothetical protein